MSFFFFFFKLIDVQTPKYVHKSDELEIRCPYIILIGISDYIPKKWNNLDGVKNDVETFYNLFKNEFKYPHVLSHIIYDILLCILF